MDRKRKATIIEGESERGTGFLAIIAIVIVLIISYLFYNKELTNYECHNCGAKMVEKTDSKPGNKVYCCSTFPICRNTFYYK
tara:strand:+ start:424 stop:669 length:246 start_codon:yes stop_codon:yes gene_type:complete